MDCERVRHLISDGYDRPLSSTERGQIVQHIDSCAGCARFERALRSGAEGIGHLADITPSAQLWEQVHTQAAVMSSVTPSRLMRQAGGMLGAAVAVVLVAALTIFLLNNNAPSTKDGPSSWIRGWDERFAIGQLPGNQRVRPTTRSQFTALSVRRNAGEFATRFERIECNRASNWCRYTVRIDRSPNSHRR